MITFLELGNFGRLGNQLWQIASTIGIATKNETEYAFPEWEYEKYFINLLPRISFKEWKDYEEVNSAYQDILLSDKFDWDLKGYFQSWKYFRHCEDTIKDQLSFPSTPKRGVVGVHVRRGDYLSLEKHPVLPMSYYEEALKRFSPDRFEFLIFSDDMPWCRENFNFPRYNFYFSEEKVDIDDFISFTNCEHQIIANSSFSWWGAYLNDSPQKIVVAPRVWVYGEEYDDRTYPTWEKI